MVQPLAVNDPVPDRGRSRVGCSAERAPRHSFTVASCPSAVTRSAPRNPATFKLDSPALNATISSGSDIFDPFAVYASAKHSRRKRTPCSMSRNRSACVPTSRSMHSAPLKPIRFSARTKPFVFV